MNQDVEGLHSGPPAVDYIYNSGDNGISVQDNNIPPVEDNTKSIVNTPEVSVLSPPPSPKKKGYPKGSKNRITDNTPLGNRYITRFQSRTDILPVVLTTKIDDLDNKVVKDKCNTYYIVFLVGSESPENPIILAEVLSRSVKEVNE